MNEVQRRQYLHAIGVDSYQPRLVLPGALPSTLCELPIEPSVLLSIENVDSGVIQSSNNNDNNSASNNANNNSSQKTNFSDAAKLALDTIKPASIPIDAVVNATMRQVEKKSQEKKVTPHFSLSIIRGENILIIDKGLPGNINPNDYLQLLKNMLFALGAGKQQVSIDAFVWPMVKSNTVDQGEVAARQTLEAFLAKQIEQLGAKYLLLMGDDAARYSCSEQLTKGQLVAQSNLGIKIIHTLSASDMLQNALLKRDVWQHLQPLYKALQY